MDKLKYLFVLVLILILTLGCGDKEKKSDGKKHEAVNSTITKSENFDSFLFVGMIDHKAGLYKYNLKEKKYSQYWSNYNEQVVDLSYSPDWKTAYFLTAGHFGKTNIFPYITRVKVYLSDIDSSKIKFIKKLGDGIQVFTHWEDNYNFKVIINRIDKIVATYINSDIYIFNLFGKELLSEKQTYDLTKSGYPRPKPDKISFNSPSGSFKLINRSIDSTDIYIENKIENSTDFLIRVSQKLNNFAWSPDEKQLIFSTINVSSKNKTLNSKMPETSGLYIYDIIKKKIIMKWEGAGVKNFYIKNDLLIFDSGFDINSTITIFNYKTLQLIDLLKIKHGCGLRNIPQIPNIRA